MDTNTGIMNENNAVEDANKELMVALMNKINSILTDSDDTTSKITDSYLTWCMPGLPFQPADLQFAVKGINGKDADETRTLVRNASDFSRVVNFVPTSHILDGSSKNVYSQNGKVLWDIYDEVLKYSEVATGNLTDDQKNKIEKFRKLLTVTKIEKDIVTDEEKEVVEDGPMIKAYKGKEKAYLDAVTEYNNKRLSALNSDDKLSVQDFTLNADNYRRRVRMAMDDWASAGYKNDVEKIHAFIDQVSKKDLTLMKRDLQDRLEKGKMTDPNSGGSFYLTSVYPGNFVNSDDGWTKFTFSSENKDTYSKQTHSSTSASVGLGWGLWRIGASGSYEKDTSLETMQIKDFSIEFSITQVPLARPWFSPEFLLNTAWRFKPGMGMADLCDGSNPPAGQLTAYPTTAIFIKDVKITSSNINSLDQLVSSKIGGGGSVGYGLFRIGGSHKSSSSEAKTSYSKEGNTLSISGMQLIAFKCFPMPKSPNPSSDITAWA